jgi:hypothetical protein
MSRRETAKKQLVKCSDTKCVKEGTAFKNLKNSFVKELATLSKRNEAKKIPKTKLVKEINEIGKSHNVRKAAETYVSCLQKKCAKELRTAERRKLI